MFCRTDKFVSVDTFKGKINKVLKFSHLFTVLLAFPIVIVLVMMYVFVHEISLPVCIQLAATLFVVLLIILALTPAKIEITSDGRLIVRAVILRKVDYGKITSITKPTQVPKLFCPFGNRGFYGFWAWCDSPEGFIVFISERKCNHLYKIRTEKGNTMYVCTEKELPIAQTHILYTGI